jgi:hypothetical protein
MILMRSIKFSRSTPHVAPCFFIALANLLPDGRQLGACLRLEIGEAQIDCLHAFDQNIDFHFQGIEAFR